MTKYNKGLKGSIYVDYNNKIEEEYNKNCKDFLEETRMCFWDFKYNIYISEYQGKDILEIEFVTYEKTFKEAKQNLVLFKNLFKQYFGVRPKDIIIGTFEKVF